jgi:Spy/CpxP family protein refolding chaperone
MQGDFKMKHTFLLGAAVVAFIPGVAPAQHPPYAGQESREIKALSGEETKQYLAGSGLGYAQAAELNHYPGLLHVLELADRLSLSPQQRLATEALMKAHKTEARAIGAKLVEAERTLDQLFSSGKVSATALQDQVKAVAAVQGEYRLSHLETHRRMRDILTAEQVRRYDELRGYCGGHQPRDAAQKHH